MVVPRAARGHIAGAVTLVSSRPGRRYGPADLQMAEHLARRAGLAVDNARLYREAQQAVRARDEVLAFASHDLKNPLGAVLVSAALLQRDRGASPQVARHAALIRRSAERMDRLIHDLLDLSSMEAGKLKVEPTAQDAAALLADAAALFQPQATVRRLTLEIQAERGTPPALADRDRVLRVLSNLVGNSFAFTPPEGRITLACAQDGDSVRFSVTDTGPGIPEEDQPHVFDRYWKSDASRRGSGLGLAIARGIVDAHGGRIWFQTHPGVGTTFHFTLPASRSS